MAQCRLEAAHAAHTDDIDQISVPYFDDCMQSKGFTETLDAPGCGNEADPLYVAACYKPM
jgi:hypothetical protein